MKTVVLDDAMASEASPAETIGEGGFLRTRRQLLRHALDEIDEQLAARRQLHGRFRGQVEEELKEVVRAIAGLPQPWRIGYDVPLEGLRSALHKNAVSRKRELRQEELRLWEDVGRLLEKRRELERELMLLRSASEADATA